MASPWIDADAGKIQRGNRGMTAVEGLVSSGCNELRGIALDRRWRRQDPARQPWRDRGGCLGRASMSCVALPWADAGAGKIQRGNRGGTAVDDLVSSVFHKLRGIALDRCWGRHDLARQPWRDHGGGRIHLGLSQLRGIALHAAADERNRADAGTGRSSAASVA